MDGIRPFSATPRERTEIRNLFKVISCGGSPADYPELKGVYPKYKTVFDIFEIIVDVRYGNLLHLPFSGGVMDQGAKTMEFIKYIQQLFRRKIIDDNRTPGNKILR